MRKGMRLTFTGLTLGICFACSSTPQTETASRSPAGENDEYVWDASTCTEDVSPSQQGVIDSEMGNHEHRLYHFLWHATRNSWTDLSDKEKKTIQTLNPEWGGNAPLCPANKTYAGPKDVAGEEFLLMHHKMLAHLQEKLHEKNLHCIGAWKKLPKKNDKDFPVPPIKGDDSKTDEEGDRLDSWAAKFRDPAFLRGKSLSYVGMILESSLHNHMHMRWSEAPKTGDDFSPSFTSRALLAKSSYDQPRYNWLGNPYHAHVNPVFWKLHGFVDDTITAWLKANGKSKIAEDCRGNSACYQWKAVWLGGMEHDDTASMSMPKGMSHAPANPGDVDAVLKKISSKAGFGNPKFMSRATRMTSKGMKMGTPNPAGDPQGDADTDPLAYFAQFGPCSGR